MIITIISFIFVFGLLVFVHELGHYIFARIFKVRVLEFAFGFPPRLWSKKKGKTEYSVNAIPLGGYVRLLGEDWGGEKALKSPENLNNKKTWQRITILFAGVAFNFILAWLLLTGFYLFGGKPIVAEMWDYDGVVNSQKVYIVSVDDERKKNITGVYPGDILLSVNGQRVYRLQEAITEIQSSGEKDMKKPINVVISHNGQESERKLSLYEKDGKIGIGVWLENKGNIRAVWYPAPVIALRETARLTVLTAQSLGEFFVTLFTKFRISEGVGGPVAIFELSGVAASLGPSIFIQFIVILSISLAVINIFPFPALDGGHIAIILWEKLTGKTIKRELKESIIKWGFGLLLLLIAVVTVNDLVRSNVIENIKGIFK